MPASVILDIQKLDILTVFPLKGAIMRQHQRPHGRICTKFDTAAGAADVIICINLFVLCNGYEYCGSVKLSSPIDKASRR